MHFPISISFLLFPIEEFIYAAWIWIISVHKYLTIPSQTMVVKMEQAESERSFIANEADESVIIDYPQRQGATEGESDDFMSVDDLQQCGIGAVDIQKLKLAGICTIKVSWLNTRVD